MDPSIILGLGTALLAIFISLFIEGGSLASLVNISAFVLITGGTIGATIISFSIRDIARLPALLLQTFRSGDPDMASAIAALIEYAEFARREGILALESRADEAPSHLLRHGINLAADGLDPEEAAAILYAESNQSRSVLTLGANILETAGGYAPTMGIIGTVMGLVRVLSNISDTTKLAESIAVAFLATFYGIAGANLFWLPLANKLKERARQEKIKDDAII